MLKGLRFLVSHLPHATIAVAKFLWCVLVVWHDWEGYSYRRCGFQMEL